MFRRNVGILDRIVRVALGLVLVPVGLILLVVLQSNVPGLVTAGFGGIGLITGITGVCPLYIPFGINTREKEKELIGRFRERATGMMDRCMSMMAGFHQVPADRASSSSEQTRATTAGMMDRCMSMMASFRQAPADRASPSAEQTRAMSSLDRENP